MLDGNPQSPSSTFVGRERELGELRAGLSDAAAGHGRMFLISGEPGIGKTRLAQRIASEASRPGMRVIWGRCWEGGGAPAYWPVVQIIRGCAEHPDFAQAVEGLGRAISYVAALVPEIIPPPTHPERSGSDPVDPEQARFRLFDAVVRLLKSMAANRPLLLILDDLHDADTASLEMLTFVARALKDAAVLLLGTHREAEVERSPELRTQISELAREGDQLRIGGLSHADIAQLVGTRTGIAPTEQLVAALHDTSEGNPLFLGGIVQMLASEGRLERQDRLTATDLKLPATVRGSISSRLSRLSSRTIAILSVAAALGVEFEIVPLERVVGVSTEELMASLDEAAAMAVVRNVPSTPSVFRFTHPLFRSVSYESITSAERARLHRQIGETLEALYGGDNSSHLAQIANHFRLAAPAGTAEKAIAYAIRAANAAREVFAHADAAKLLRDVLPLCDGQPAQRRADVLQRLGDVTCFFVNREEGIGYLEKALRLYEELGSEEKVAEVNIALGVALAAIPALSIPRALEHFRPRRSRRGHQSRSRMLDRGLSFALLESLRIDEAIAASHRAIEILERESDPKWIVAAGTCAQCLMAKGRHREAVALLDRACGAAKQTADPDIFRSVTWSAGWYRLLMRDALEAKRLFEAGMESSLLSSHQRADHFDFLALTRVLLGDLSGAKALAAEKRVLPTFRSRILFREGDWESAKELFLEFLESTRKTGTLWTEEDTLSHLSELVRVTGDLELAAELSQQALSMYAPSDLFWEMRNRPQAALLAIDRDQLVDATHHVEVCRTIMAQGEGWLGHAGFVARAEAMLAAAEARDFSKHFENAISIFLRYGLRFDEADTLHYWGCALSRAGQYSRANDKFDAAAEIYRQSGAGQRWIERVEEARPRPRGSSNSADHEDPSPSAAENTFRNDGDFWTITYQGNTTRVRNLKGLGYIAYLLTHPGVRIHVSDLIATVDGGATPAPGREDLMAFENARDLGDAGEALDAQAVAEYRERIVELRGELAEAEKNNDPGASERARRELEQIDEHLRRNVGQGGRLRRTSSHVERARAMVTKNIRAGIERIRRHDAKLGGHFETSIRTGAFCAYLLDLKSITPWQT